MAARVLCVFLILQIISCVELSKRAANDGFIDTLSTGVKFAKDFLGSESVALKVAEFVVRAFQTRNSPNNQHPQQNNDYSHNTLHNKDRFYSSDKYTDHDDSYNEHTDGSQPSLNPLRHLVRLFGLQPPQLSAVAVNALVFVAQMISTFLSGPQTPGKPYRSDDPTSWILSKNSRRLQDLLATAKNDSLPDMIEDIVSDQGNQEETACIRLLVCKIIPFVVKMQRTVFKNNENDNSGNRDEENRKGAWLMYRHLPTTEEINSRHDICQNKYPLCDLNH